MLRHTIFTLFLAFTASVFADALPQPKVHLTFNDDSIVNLGTTTLTGVTFYDQQGDQPVYVSTGLGDMKAIKFDGTNYIDTTTSTTAFNIEGAKAKTVLAFIKSDMTGNYCLWQVGNRSNYQDFTIKVDGPNALNGQHWTGDYNTTAPVATTADWALVALTYDGTTSRIYYNGLETGSKTVALNTGTGNLQIAYWNDLANSYRGGIAEFQIYDSALTSAQLQEIMRPYGGKSASFSADQYVIGVNGTDGWVASNAKMMVTAQRVSGCAATNLAAATNVNGQSGDDYTGVLWGEAFTVADDSKLITIEICGGHFNAPTVEKGAGNIQSFAGIAGFVLYDVTAGKFLLDTYRSSSSNKTTAETQTVSLTGLAGHTVVPTLVDFATGAYGMVALKSLNVPVGTTDGNLWQQSSVTKSWSFDSEEEFKANWFEVDKNGNRLDSIKNFRLGAHTACAYYVGSNFMTSNYPGGGWDASMVILRSETFKVTGDVIEFLIDGGAASANPVGQEVEFQLWVDSDGDETFEKVFSTNRSASTNDFEYQIWDVSEYKEANAYFQIYDNRNANWAWVGLDNIQMISFDYVPEPATWALLALGVLLFKASPFRGGGPKGRRGHVEAV